MKSYVKRYVNSSVAVHSKTDVDAVEERKILVTVTIEAVKLVPSN